ncbi:MAG: PglZ domain-containing protein [Rhodospirillales bacterium]|nr:MAG: PglZ domain-containing protein [Rhodospirillales bacterium]
MTTADFIRNEVLLPRLKQRGVLVVYDPARRYRTLCQGLGSDEVVVVDAGDSSIESREAALTAFRSLGTIGDGSGPSYLLVYVPTGAPVDDNERCRDPFSLYAVCGGVFPDGDGDDYLSLCLKAKPDHVTAVRAVFAENPDPEFAVIDTIGGGVGWPMLRAALGAESGRDILYALLVPSAAQKADLQAQEGWVAEARDLLANALGLALKTRGKTWSSIADEIWRFVLFSEFVFDLPGVLPDALSQVPRAPDAARPLVEDLCDRLRRDVVARQTYVERATAIEAELNLPAVCSGITDLGGRDTFPFEERAFLRRAADALAADELDTARAIIRAHAGSVWVAIGESQAQWTLVEAALHLIESCDDHDRQLPDAARTQDTLIDFYLAGLRESDRRQREFETAVNDSIGGDDLAALIDAARDHYRRLAEKVQLVFTKHVATGGWPPAGRLANADVFDRLVAPLLKDRARRVAYILVDALRYELGLALQQQLGEDQPVELQAAFAQLPSTTAVGMASLLPGAGNHLRLVSKNGDYLPMLGDSPVANVNQRMDILRRQYGDRFKEMQLGAFVRSKPKIPVTVDLLVLRSGEIDSHLETDAETALGLVHDTLRRLRAAVHKLKSEGFQHVVVATDHGFFLNAHAEAGDVCTKPPGTWLTVHERTLLGDGKEDAHNFVLPAERLGIRGEFAEVAGPRSLVPYRRGLLYFHGGASLPEAVVPVLSIRLEPAPPRMARAKVTLGYRSGAKRITTRLPVLDVLLEAENIFATGEEFEILLEAHDKKGKVVGEAKAGGPVNAATGTVTLKPGERVQVTLRMQLEFEGRFSVKALDPTTLATLSSIDLETAYTV